MLTYLYLFSPVSIISLSLILPILAVIPFAMDWLNSLVIDKLIDIIKTHNFQFENIAFYIIFYTGIFISIPLFNILFNYFQFKLRIDLMREFDQLILKKFSSLDQKQYQNPEIRDLITSINENSHRTTSFVISFFGMIQPLFLIIISFYIIYSLSPMILIILILFSIPEFFKNIFFGEQAWSIWDSKINIKRDYFVTKNAVMQYELIKEIKLLNLREYFLTRIYKKYGEFESETVTVEYKRFIYSIVLSVVRGIGFGLIILLILNLVMKGNISIGQFFFYINAVRHLDEGLINFFKLFADLFEHSLYIKDLFVFFDIKNTILSGPYTIEKEVNPPLIEFKNVSFKYPDTKNYILNNFNLQITPGEHIAIVGENGAGKTTLMYLLMRLYDVNNGKISIDNTDIKDLDLENWYSKMASLLQHFHIYHFTAKENIAMGNIKDLNNIERIMKSSIKSGAHKFISKFPLQYNQILDPSFENGHEPSPGQKQRIAIARIFFRDAPILILDEPTSSLDPKAEMEVFNEIYKFSENKTVIIISHRFSTVRNASRIIVLDEGRIIEDGTHEQLVKIKNGKYRNAYEIQKKGFE
jgi:ABC-type multidrug transport system fused ATPase/permease subunit